MMRRSVQQDRAWSSRPFSAAILAGGRSSRFGTNKALSLFDGRPLLTWPVETLRPATDDLFLVANDPDPYAAFGLPIHADARPGMGALSGLHSALTHSRHDRILVVGCDMPWVDRGLFELLLDAIEGHDAAVPISDSGIEPLHAVYHRGALAAMERALDAGSPALKGLLKDLNCRQVAPEEWRSAATGPNPFANINTQQERDCLLDRMKRDSDPGDGTM